MNSKHRKISNFHLGRCIHDGNKTEVFEGRVAQAGGVVQSAVIKILRPQYACIGEELRAFLKESAWARALKAPACPRVIETGEDEGTYFLAMAKIQGWTLTETLRALGLMQMNMPAKTILWIALQAAKSLHNLHNHEHADKSKGVVHLGIDPSNIMLSKTGMIKIIDFSRMTQVGSRLPFLDIETEEYKEFCAPEVLTGAVATTKSDIFSLGVLLRYLYKCMPDKKVSEDFEILSRIACHSKPSHRFKDMQMFTQALERMARKWDIPLESNNCSDFTADLFGHSKEKRERRGSRPQSIVPFRNMSESIETRFCESAPEQKDDVDFGQTHEHSVNQVLNEPKNRQGTAAFSQGEIEQETAFSQKLDETSLFKATPQFVDEQLAVTAFSSVDSTFLAIEETKEKKHHFVDEHLAVTIVKDPILPRADTIQEKTNHGQEHTVKICTMPEE